LHPLPVATRSRLMVFQSAVTHGALRVAAPLCHRADEPGVKVDLNSLLHDLYFERQDAKYYQAWGITYALEDHVREDLIRRYPVFQSTEPVTDEELERLQQEVDAPRSISPG
jgi:hypothetical protein